MEFIDLHNQYETHKKEFDNAIASVINSTHFISGEEVKQLENKLSEYVGVKYCLSCGNGTDALTLAMRALDVKEGDAVFVADFTYFASAEVIASQHATPIFVDVDRTFNIDTNSLLSAIEMVKKEGKLHLKAIIAVDLFGQPANYPKIRKIADEFGMAIVEDGAQGFGGTIQSKRACSFGDISTTSFFPVKPLGCYGDGGAVFTNNKDYYDLMSSLAVHGKGADKYDNVRIGYNSRLDTLQASILLVKLKIFEKELIDRNLVADKYTMALSQYFLTPFVQPGYGSSWAQYTLICRDSDEREKIRNNLKSKGIPTLIYYLRPMHTQKAFSETKKYVNCPYSDYLSQRVISIPMSPYINEAEQETIIEALINN
jgi:UDP-2-acetamido-2-deoxy-ribo-hexuluronate aminotransferase